MCVSTTAEGNLLTTTAHEIGHHLCKMFLAGSDIMEMSQEMIMNEKRFLAKSFYAYAFFLCVSSFAHGGDVSGLKPHLVECAGEGVSAWLVFEKMVDDEAVKTEFLLETARRAKDWRLLIVADAVRFCRDVGGSPRDILDTLLVQERSWRGREELDIEVPEELSHGLYVTPVPGFDPQSPLKHVVARKDRLEPAGDKRELLLYTLMTLPSHVSRAQEEYEQMGLEMPHELLCARTMLFLRLAKDPFDDDMKNIMMLEIERGFCHLPLRDAVLAHCDGMILESLSQVQPSRAWGQDVLAKLPFSEARDILLEWSRSDDPAERTDAYISLLGREEEFNEKIVSERIAVLREKYYSMKVIMKKMEEYKRRMDEMNNESAAADEKK